MNQVNQSSIHLFRRLIESRESDCDEVLQNLKGLSSILKTLMSVIASDAVLTDILSPLYFSSPPFPSAIVGNKIAANLFLDAESILSNISSLLLVRNSVYCSYFSTCMITQYLHRKRLKEQEYGFVLGSNNALNLTQENNVIKTKSCCRGRKS